MSVRVDPDRPYRVPLSGEERQLLRAGLAEWHGPAHPTEAMAQAMGFDSIDDLLHVRGERLREALGRDEALTHRDWRRLLTATAVVFADSTTGAGLDWPIVATGDARTITLLRALQRRTSRLAPEAGEEVHDALRDRLGFAGGRQRLIAIAPTTPLTAAPGVLAVPRYSQDDAELVSYAIDAAAAPAGRALKLTVLATPSGDHPGVIEATVAMLARRRPDVDVEVLRLFPRPSVSDLRDHLRHQDVVLVTDGSPTGASALWTAHGVKLPLLHAWRAGVVLVGIGAGALCWHASGLTTDVGVSPWIDPPHDDLPAPLALFTDGLGFLRHSLDLASDDPTGDRATHYPRLVATGALEAGYAIDAGTALHYSGEGVHEVVTTRPGARARRVRPTTGHTHREEPLTVRAL